MRAAVLYLVGLLGLGLIGLWLWLPKQAQGSPTPLPGHAAAPNVQPADQVIEKRPAGAIIPTRNALTSEQLAAAYSLDGEGTLRGHMVERAGAVFPREWDLVLEPHPYLEGRERAESRRIPFRAGERDFRVEHLHLGGYLVRAEAAGMNSSHCDVLLVKGSSNQFVDLALSPAGFLDGSVLGANGAPAEGVEVQLVETTTHARHDTTSDGAGAYQFGALVDGDYELSFCIGGVALCEPRLLGFRAPRLSFPVVTLPPTGTLAVHVFDLLGKPAIGERVTGFGHPKGALDLRTDEQGTARLRWALPGQWQIQALDQAENLRAQGELVVAAGVDASMTLRLAR
jgi:hypothetical protein